MYTTGTQKKFWTFSSQEEINRLRQTANENFIAKYRQQIESGRIALDEFFSPKDELVFCRIVADTGMRFYDDFVPSLWPSVRWHAYAYFKRFYLRQSTMEYFPKNVMTACYYLATKIDEFNISIDTFVENLKSGKPEKNSESILKLEPEIMRKLDYQLAVHSPFRAFEGHLIDIKSRCSLDFDLEAIRPFSEDFFQKTLLGDSMLLYPPSQIALSALKYGLTKLEKPFHIFKDYLNKLLEIDISSYSLSTEKALQLEKLQIRVDQICDQIICSAMPYSNEICQEFSKKSMNLTAKLYTEEEANPIPDSGTTSMLDSDDDY